MVYCPYTVFYWLLESFGGIEYHSTIIDATQLNCSPLLAGIAAGKCILILLYFHILLGIPTFSLWPKRQMIAVQQMFSAQYVCDALLSEAYTVTYLMKLNTVRNYFNIYVLIITKH